MLLEAVIGKRTIIARLCSRDDDDDSSMKIFLVSRHYSLYVFPREVLNISFLHNRGIVFAANVI